VAPAAFAVPGPARQRAGACYHAASVDQARGLGDCRRCLGRVLPGRRRDRIAGCELREPAGHRTPKAVQSDAPDQPGAARTAPVSPQAEGRLNNSDVQARVP
jgi:hypothetical protein